MVVASNTAHVQHVPLIPLSHYRWYNPLVISMRQNTPVLQLPSDIRIQTCVLQWPTFPLPVSCTEILKCLKFLPLNFSLRPSRDKCLNMVTEGMLRDFYKILTRSCFSRMCSSDGYQRWVEVKGGCLSFVVLLSSCYWQLHTISYQWSSELYLMNTANLGRFQASLWRTFNCRLRGATVAEW